MCARTHTHTCVIGFVLKDTLVRCRCAAVAFMMPTATTVDATACCASCAGGTAIPDSLVNVCALEVQYIWHLQRETPELNCQSREIERRGQGSGGGGWAPSNTQFATTSRYGVHTGASCRTGACDSIQHGQQTLSCQGKHQTCID